MSNDELQVEDRQALQMRSVVIKDSFRRLDEAHWGYA